MNDKQIENLVEQFNSQLNLQEPYKVLERIIEGSYNQMEEFVDCMFEEYIIREKITLSDSDRDSTVLSDSLNEVVMRLQINFN